MLQAIIQNKAHAFFSRHARRPQEDIITSCVFGALRYMPPASGGALLSWLAPERAELQKAIVEDLELWPRRARVRPREIQREPDALIHMTMQNGEPLRIIVEVKWESAVLGRHQARDQWQQFGVPSGVQGKVIHLFIVKALADASATLAQETAELGKVRGSTWSASQVLLSWFDVARRLRDETTPNTFPEARRLASDLRMLLRELGERPFHGFRDIQSFEILPTQRVFYASRSNG